MTSGFAMTPAPAWILHTAAPTCDCGPIFTRLARPGNVVAPATLLALVAWQAGNGPLANVALDRALTAEPNYALATILRRLFHGTAWPMPWPIQTPEEVAAVYAPI